MKFRLLLAALLLCLTPSWAQQGTTSTATTSANVSHVQGVAPGYRPTKVTGRTLNVAKGTAFCNGRITEYVGGNFILNASSTLYVYLDPLQECAPTVSNVEFSSNGIPVAVVTTNTIEILTIKDVRTWSVGNSAGTGGIGQVKVNNVNLLSSLLVNFDPAGDVSFSNPSGGNITASIKSTSKFGGAPGNKLVTTSLSSDPSIGECAVWLSGGKLGSQSCAVGAGTVTSVGLSMPAIFSVANSPITGAGTLAVTFAGGQASGLFLASPPSSSGAVSLRQIVPSDILSGTVVNERCVRVNNLGQLETAAADCGTGGGGGGGITLSIDSVNLTSQDQLNFLDTSVFNWVNPSSGDVQLNINPNSITGAMIDESSLAAIPNSALTAISDRSKLPAPIAYEDEQNVFQTAGPQIIRSTAAAGNQIALIVDSAVNWGGTDKLFVVRNNGLEKLYIDFNGNIIGSSISTSAQFGTFQCFGAGCQWRGMSLIADSGTAIAFDFNTLDPLTVSGAKIVRFRNDDVEKASVDKDGIFNTVTGYQIGGAALNFSHLAGSIVTSQIGNSQVTYAKIQNVSTTSRLLGRITAGSGPVEELTGTQVTSLLNVFTSSLAGLVPASGGGTTNFLRADGQWVIPPTVGDSITVKTVAALDPDFIDSSKIAVTLNVAPDPDTIAFSIVANSLSMPNDLATFTSAELAGRLTNEYGTTGVFARVDFTNADINYQLCVTDVTPGAEKVGLCSLSSLFSDDGAADSFRIGGNVTPSKVGTFDIDSNVPSSTTVVLKWPSANGTLAVSATAPLVLNTTTGNLTLSQNAGTDVTADLEEETHASEHQHGGNDEIAVFTAAANAIPKADGSGDLDPAFIINGTVTNSRCLRVDGTGKIVVHSNDCGAGGGATLFTDLTDAPSSYTGHANKFVKVNSGETGLEFVSSSVAGHDLLSSSHGDTVASAATRGSIIVGNATPAWAALAIGSPNRYVCSDGTDVSWCQVSLTSGVTGTLSESLVDSALLRDAELASITVTKTNMTFDAEAAGNVLVTSHYWTWSAVCQGTSAGLPFDLPASNAPAASCVTGSNTIFAVADFDAGTDESVQGHVKLPDDWSGNIDLEIRWFSAATSGDVVFALQTACVGVGETSDPSFNTAQTVTDTAAGTTNQENTAAINTVTVTGCSAGETLHFKFFRDADNGSDTMSGDARVKWISFKYRRSQ